MRRFPTLFFGITSMRVDVVIEIFRRLHPYIAQIMNLHRNISTRLRRISLVTNFVTNCAFQPR